MTELDEKLRAVGAMWGGADYDGLAQTFAPIHDRLVAALGPRPGERWLDLATGTGEVALRAARAGATVVGLDLSEGLLAQARAKPDGDAVDWLVGDVQELPFEDASFDVVSSCFGVIFAPRSGRVASELARVARPDGRLGLTTWAPHPALDRLWDEFVDTPPPSDPETWGRVESLQALLAGFEVRVESGEWVVQAESPEAMWDFFVRVSPPLKALHDRLAEERRGDMRRVFVEAHERYRTNGGVSVARPYLLATGRRR